LRKRWYEGLKPGDLPGDLRDVAELIGMATAVRLAEKLGGAHLYVPQAESAFASAKKRYISENRNRSVRDLSRETGYSERQVYRILEELKEEDKQASLPL